MKKIIVCGALFNLICLQVYAAQTPDAISEKISTSVKPYRGLQQAEAVHPKKTNTTHQSIGINCDYRISAETQIDKTLMANWAKYAVLHSFDFDSLSLDGQLKNLRACYTKNGWLSFTNALKDNINSIKTQNLIVSSTLDGEVQLIDVQENQWKMNVPIKVLYKNDKEEVTHFLNVYIIISWRNAFKLGIVQMVATPRSASLSQKAISMREAMKGLSFSVAEQINKAESLQKEVSSFMASLFVSAPRAPFSEIDGALSQPQLGLKIERDNAKLLQHLVKIQKHQYHEKSIETQTANLILDEYKNLVKIVGIEKSAKAGVEWAKNQFLAVKTDVFDTKLPQLLSSFKERGTVGFNSALQNLKAIKIQIPASQQRDKKSQRVENKKNQWNITFPMQVAQQNDKNQITQLNVNLTIGRNTNGEPVILKVNAIPSGTTSSSNNTEIVASNAHIPSSQQRAGSIQKIQRNNEIKPVQGLEISQEAQVPNIIFNTSSEQLNRPETINCDFKIPDGMAKIDEGLAIKWAENAAIQSFDFNSASIDTQLEKLKSCYTAKGWEHFKNALDKSGNIEAIKSQNLIMSSKVSGQTKLVGIKKNQWNMELLLQVIYQNKQVKVIKFLNVNLSMERKPSGEFGITRIIATLNDPESTNKAATNLSNKNIDSVQNTQQPTMEQQKKVDLIDCDYKIPVEMKNINQDIISDWAEYAVTKSFDFDSESIDTQLKKLQSCYMEQSWYEFINSLEKSGKMKTFKTKKLRATSQIDGKIQLIESRDNIWTLSLPLKINYQFESGNVMQLLNVDLTIGRKSTGGLGIIQLNSSLRVASIPRSTELLASPEHALG
ncbi:IcmL-like protein [Legionella steigerwaltii]|uniref:IcmL-like protein n=1 Tax=Legionella steigerwaltii TaxID=460 RepID=A0A378L987_9GAMM|nr:DotI/IcmL family type IV secretion protein [Legionella steigerwaltii]KTD80939.1 IcmL-like protein [Legionella steigerwaltii]STY23373.1 IcmL-like protein [Legionella steigerwaltii]